MTHAFSMLTFDSRIPACSEAWNPPANIRPLRKAPEQGDAHSLHEQHGNDRAVVEQFIASSFRQRYGARIERFMPRLFALRDSHGSPRAAFGLRPATQRLYLEQYLDEPVETLIAARSGSVVGRESIVEVGHFCGAFPGAARTIIAFLARRLHDEGFTWVVFTGTVGLRNAFARIGMRPLTLSGALPERLPDDERATWGTYYDHAPDVLCGRIEDGLCLTVAAAAAANPAEPIAG